MSDDVRTSGNKCGECPFEGATYNDLRSHGRQNGHSIRLRGQR